MTRTRPTCRLMPGPCSLALLGALLGAPALASAQGSVTVLRIEPAAEPLCAAIESALGELEVRPDPGYHAEAQRRGLDPGSDAALDALTPLIDVDLVLIPRGADLDTLWLDYRIGRTGEPAGQVEVPLENATLGRPAASLVLRETRARLASLQGAAEGSTEMGYGGGDAVDSMDDEDADGEGAGTTAITLDVAAGLGVGMRTLEWPLVRGSGQVDVGAFPAVELLAEPRLLLSEDVALGLRLAYATSVGAEVDETHVAAFSADTFGIRSHRFEAGFGPELYFDGRKGVRLAVQAGYAVTNLRPDVHHFLTPAYSLGGPRLRLGLHIPIGDAITIGLAPHVQLIAQVGEQLEDQQIGGSGVGFGGDAALGVVLSDAFTLQLGYYESHASIGSQLGGSASDVERTGTARLLGTL